MSRMHVAALAALLGVLAVAVSPADAAAPTIDVGSNPNAIVISSAQGRAYVANDGSVSVVDLTTHHQVAEISTTVNHGQNAIGLYRAGNKAYIGDFSLNTMVSFNTATQAVKPGIRIGFGVTGFAGAGNGLACISRFGKEGTTGSIRI